MNTFDQRANRAIVAASCAKKPRPGDPYPTRHDGDVLIVEYVPYKQSLREHSIVTTKSTYDANWSKAHGGLLVHDSGSGSLVGDAHQIDPHWTYWVADGMKLTRWDRRNKTTVPATAKWIKANDVTLLAKIRRDPFVDSISVDGHIVHCSICDDYFNDDSNAPCRHLRWSDDANLTLGPGSCEDTESWLPDSVAKLCEHLGDAHSKELRDAIASNELRFDHALSSALEDIDGEPEAYGGDGCEPAMLWIDMLDGTKALAPARAAMAGWIDEVLGAERMSPIVASDLWPRVLHVTGDGYNCDFENTGREWSDRQIHATRYGKDEARRWAAAFRAVGGDAKVIRLRPRALTAGVTS